MSEFKCDKYTELYKSKGWGLNDVSYLNVNKEDDRIQIDGYELEGSVTVLLNPDTARKLAAELIKLADEIDGVYRHDEIRGTMLCSSLVMPIKPRQ